MIDELKDIDTGKHIITLKWQLSLPDGINVPLDHDVFDYAYHYGNEQGYKTTSSVADLESLKFLLQYDVPFVKIPNDRSLDWLIGYVPRMIPVYVSYSNAEEMFDSELKYNNSAMLCVSKYPAKLEEYEESIRRFANETGIPFCLPISDHTCGLDLFNKYQPCIFEKHFKLPTSTGLDAGPFAITPEELREIL
jgi:sialic acid synthase SpsE